MTLLSIVQTTLREIPGAEVPSTVAENTNETAVLSLALVNRTMLELARRYDWDQLTIRYTITTVASQEEYSLPSDWERFISGTWWDGTNIWKMEGPATAEQWERLKVWTSSTTVRRWFRLFQGASATPRKIYIFPTPAASSESLTMEYISNQPVLSAASAGKEKFTVDTDTCLLDEDIVSLGFKWRFLQSKGLPHSEEFRDFEMALNRLKGDAGGQILAFGPSSDNERGFATEEGNYTL